MLMSGFLRGGVGFLKNTGEIIKGSSGFNREVRVGVTHVSFFINMIVSNLLCLWYKVNVLRDYEQNINHSILFRSALVPVLVLPKSVPIPSNFVPILNKSVDFNN